MALVAAGVAASQWSSLLRADEGMWTFDNPPRQQWRERYQFEPSDAWLEHLRLASIRLVEGSGGGSASFVSPDGLILTNQHVAAGQLAKLSTAGRDLVRDGYYAKTRDAELKCPDLEADVLVSYEDVTTRVQGAVKAGASDAEAAAARRTAIAAIEKDSFDRTGLRSDVVTLYSGGEYWLYRYKKYTDIRLVFAPEEQIAYFGGDYDNFVFPRHDLDISFLRAYENNQPAKTPHFLKWSASGANDGDFIVLSGLPGSTDRLLTLTQITYQRDVGNPLQKRVWESRRNTLVAYGKTSPEAARRASATIRGLENSLKRLVGQQQGLENPRMIARKRDEEQALRNKVTANPAWQQQYAGAWDRLDALYKEVPAQAPRLAMALQQLAERLAGEQGKRVELSISGLDRVPEDQASIIYDILSQLLRNAIEHGIEMPSQRTAASKPAVGSVLIEYRHRHGQHADLVVQDDGQGLNAPRILEAATSAGVIGAAAAAELDPRQASTLIFQSGVSTAGEGRGAGMRIVRDHIKRLGGQIQIATKRGQYLRLRMRIPVEGQAVLRAQA